MHFFIGSQKCYKHMYYKNVTFWGLYTCFLLYVIHLVYSNYVNPWVQFASMHACLTFYATIGTEREE